MTTPPKKSKSPHYLKVAYGESTFEARGDAKLVDAQYKTWLNSFTVEDSFPPVDKTIKH